MTRLSRSCPIARKRAPRFRKFPHRRERPTPMQAFAWLGQHASMVSSISAGHRALPPRRRALANCCYLLTVTNCQRQRIVDDFQLAASACRVFIAALQEDAALPAWVLMPDHVHWLVQLGNVTPLARVVSCMKTASTRAVNQQRWVPAAVWARAYQDRGLRKETICAAWLVTSSPIRYAPDWSSGSAIPHSGM
ncbi:transposase [Xanthomonas oryzae]|uniref:transposase n=2 Tax=Xanthomonas oryzae TaxID=347 RepID=UPI00274069DE|nr:transposase [Xanthomonas oryzae]